MEVFFLCCFWEFTLKYSHCITWVQKTHSSNLFVRVSTKSCGGNTLNKVWIWITGYLLKIKLKKKVVQKEIQSSLTVLYKPSKNSKRLFGCVCSSASGWGSLFRSCSSPSSAVGGQCLAFGHTLVTGIWKANTMPSRRDKSTFCMYFWYPLSFTDHLTRAWEQMYELHFKSRC